MSVIMRENFCTASASSALDSEANRLWHFRASAISRLVASFSHIAESLIRRCCMNCAISCESLDMLRAQHSNARRFMADSGSKLVLHSLGQRAAIGGVFTSAGILGYVFTLSGMAKSPVHFSSGSILRVDGIQLAAGTGLSGRRGGSTVERAPIDYGK